MSINRAALKILREKVFRVNDKWPQYNLLLDFLCNLSGELGPESKVLIIERNLLYGGLSPFSLFFSPESVKTVDCTPAGAIDRGAYNAPVVNELIPFFDDYSNCSISDTLDKIRGDQFDCIVIPNLIHHIPVSEQRDLFDRVKGLLIKGGKLVVFEPTVREIHQAPYHYMMYTPEGMCEMLNMVGFQVERSYESGSPFDAAGYCLQVCLEYLDENKNAADITNIKDVISSLRRLESHHVDNLKRSNTRFPTSFLVEALK